MFPLSIHNTTLRYLKCLFRVWQVPGSFRSNFLGLMPFWRHPQQIVGDTRSEFLGIIAAAFQELLQCVSRDARNDISGYFLRILRNTHNKVLR